MKKIMFNDRFGLTEAVLQGHKTMTRRVAYQKALTHELHKGLDGSGHLLLLDGWQQVARSTYQIGEEVAIAQPYKCLKVIDREMRESAGYNNKLFVRSDLMPHSLVIDGIRVERLQDISDADCRREGIVPITWRQYHKQALDDLSPQRYTDHHVYTLEKFREGISDPWADSDPDEYLAETPQIAFAVLISKMMGRKVWEQNPYVFVYTFALLK